MSMPVRSAGPGSWLCVIALLSATLAGACAGSEGNGARIRYNEALEAYASGQWDDAREGFLEARQSAGQDPDLRYRAAFNLGLALARQADTLAGDESPKGLEKAMDRLRESAAWFGDAVRLRPKDKDARVNLEVVLRRIQVLADQLNRDQKRLEARLDKVIEDQRTLRDRIRQLMMLVAESQSSAEPVAFQSDFDSLATFERTLLADVGTVSDLAGDELGHLQSKAKDEPDQLGDDEKVRMVQLENLEFYLQLARGELADTRRLLRKLQGDRAHAKSDAGLGNLKRAREQLLDPITVLKAVAQDQTTILMYTAGLAQIEKQSIALDGTDDTAGDAEALKAPPWLTVEHLGDRQGNARQRVSEVLARFQAAAQNADSQGQDHQAQDASSGQPEDPRQARMLQSARDAIPYLQTAVTAMDEARTALAGASLEQAAKKQNQALMALFAAIERFSGIRDLIELTYRDHGEAVALLTPPGTTDRSGQTAPPLPEHLQKLSTSERAARISDDVSKNLDRLARLKGLFEDELASLDAKAQQAAATQDPRAGNAAAQDGQAEQIAAAKQQFEQAEALRVKALDSLTRLSALVTAAGKGKGKAGEALVVAREGMTHIEELRRLFYSIIEHLKELLRNQTDTHDSTGSAATAAPDEIASRLGPLVDVQKNHAGMGEALANALAEQADAAAQNSDPNAQDPNQGERLAQAAEEVRQATEQMSGAATFLAEDLQAAATMSPDMTSAMDAQRKAMEHLEKAIELLEPPQQQQDQQQQDQQQQDQQQQQQQQQEEEMSQQQAERRLQEIRDREAERMREKQRQQQHKPEPVEKDW